MESLLLLSTHCNAKKISIHTTIDGFQKEYFSILTGTMLNIKLNIQNLILNRMLDLVYIKYIFYLYYYHISQCIRFDSMKSASALSTEDELNANRAMFSSK